MSYNIDESYRALNIFLLYSIPAEVRAGFFSVNESHAHTTLEERRELSEQGHRLTILFDIHILDVGSSNPKRFANGSDARNDFGVMFFVGDVLGKDWHGMNYTKNNGSYRLCEPPG